MIAQLIKGGCQTFSVLSKKKTKNKQNNKEVLQI